MTEFNSSVLDFVLFTYHDKRMSFLGLPVYGFVVNLQSVVREEVMGRGIKSQNHLQKGAPFFGQILFNFFISIGKRTRRESMNAMESENGVSDMVLKICWKKGEKMRIGWMRKDEAKAIRKIGFFSKFTFRMIIR